MASYPLSTAPQAESRQKVQWAQSAAACVVLAFVTAVLYLGRPLLIPIALAMLLSFLLQPAVRLLERFGLPRVPTVLTVVALVAIAFATIGSNVFRQIQGFAHELRANPVYLRNLDDKVASLSRMGAGGALSDLQVLKDRVVARFQQRSAPEPPAIVLRAETEPAWKALVAAVTPLLEPLGSAALVIILVIFMLIGREDLRNRLIGLLGHGRLMVTTRALNDAGHRIGRYLLMQLFVNVTYGIALGLILFAIGVPFASLWGFVAAVLRYVPYVGPWMGAAFPLVTSMVAFSGWTEPLMVLGIIVVLEMLSNMVMEPLLYGHSVGMSPVALILAAALWTMVWGPIGLVIATPLTVCLVVLGQHVPRLRFFAVLLGDQPALPPSISYYQRLVARDRSEAQSIVQEMAADAESLDMVYDQVLIPALVRTRRDRCSDSIDADDEAYILQATRDIIEALDSRQPDDATDHHASDSRRPMVLGCPAHHESEELALEMLAGALRRDGCRAEMMSTKALPSEILERIQSAKPSVVFVAVIPPSGFSQASYLCRQLRRSFPDLPVVVGYWGNKRFFDDVLRRLRGRGASFVTTSIGQARKQIASLVDVATTVLPDTEEEPEVCHEYS